MIGTATAAPYSYAWQNLAAGSYSLTAVATDEHWASTTSAAMSINVNASPPARPSRWRAAAHRAARP